jgi:hypothetical protein
MAHELQCTLFCGIDSIATGVLLGFLIEEGTMGILLPNIEPMDSNVLVILSIMGSKSGGTVITLKKKNQFLHR